MKGITDYILESEQITYYIWQEDSDWYGTTEENKNARIKNARAITHFQGFKKEEDVRDYIAKWFKTVNKVEKLDRRP